MVVKKKKKTSEEDLHSKRGTMARKCTKRKGKPVEETEDLPSKRGTLARRCTMKKEKPVESEEEEEEEEENLHNKKGKMASRRTKRKAKPVETDLPNERGTRARRCTVKKEKPVETEEGEEEEEEEDLHNKKGTMASRCTKRKAKAVETEALPNKKEPQARRCSVIKATPVGTGALHNKRESQARRCTMRKGKPVETEDLHDKTETRVRRSTVRKGKPGETASIKAIFGSIDESHDDLARLAPPSVSSSDLYAASMRAIDGATDLPHEDLDPLSPPAQSALTSVSISSSAGQCVESRLQVKITSPDPATDVAVKEEPEDDWDITTLQVTGEEQGPLDQQGPIEEQGPMSEGSDIEDFDGGGGNYFDEFGMPADPENEWMRVVLVKDEEVDVGEFQADWKTQDYHPREKRAFDREPGLKVDLPDGATPLQVFSKMFTEELFLRLVTETNAYARESRSRLAETSRKEKKWADVSVMEMKTFIGLCIAMGILKLPTRRDYWRKTKWLFQTNFSQLMSRDRFAMIWRYLHLQDNHADDVDRSDRLWKMRWFLDYLSSKFQSLYEVNGSVTVDETMVKFGNRYHPHKHTKQGVKVWVMAESSTGYVTNFQVCTGRGRTQERALAQHVVMDLARPYYGSHLSVFMDNAFSGVELFQEMKRQGLNACGDVRSNRCGFLKNQTTEEAWLGNPEIKVAQKDDLTLCYWQDDVKFFSVLSNYHDPTEKGSVKRKKSASNNQPEAVVPACISDYQKHVKGVDLLEQMVGYYQFQHRSQKWWRRIFFFFLSVTCYNGYIAAKSVGGKPFTTKYRGYKYWLEDLAQELTVPVTTRRAPRVSSAPEGPPTEEHDFEKVFDKRKMCKECRSATRTVYGCRQCDEALHMECFGKHVRRFL